MALIEEKVAEGVRPAAVNGILGIGLPAKAVVGVGDMQSGGAAGCVGEIKRRVSAARVRGGLYLGIDDAETLAAGRSVEYSPVRVLFVDPEEEVIVFRALSFA